MNASRKDTTFAVFVLHIELEKDVSWKDPVPVTGIHVRMGELAGSPTLVTSSVSVVQDSREPTARLLWTHVSLILVKMEGSV